MDTSRRKLVGERVRMTYSLLIKVTGFAKRRERAKTEWGVTRGAGLS
jgi:hypothetical protein